MALELQPGQRLSMKGIDYQVMSVAAGEAKLLSDRTRRTKDLPLDYLEELRAAGEIRFSTPPIDLETAALFTMARSDALCGEVGRRRHYVAALQLEATPGSRKTIARVIKQVSHDIGDPKPPSVTAVFEWSKRYRNFRRDLTGLIPEIADKGNRESRLSETVREICLRTINTIYLSENRPSLAYAHEHANDQILLHNKACPRAREKLISYRAFRRLVKKYVDPYWKVRRRAGIAAANREFRGMSSGVVSTYPLERIEIDHTTLDVEVVDPVTGEVVGRPTLTWAIDHYSRVVLGLVVGIESPKRQLVLECLTQVLQDKTPDMHVLGIDGKRRWDMHGRPMYVVVDNGADFHSHDFQMACEAEGISIQYCPPGMPWFKGRAERFVGTLNTQLVHQLPGTTRSNARDRGAYKSEQLATMTLSEVRHITVRYVTQIYHERVHSALGTSPREAWEEGIATHPPSVVVNPDTLKLSMALRENCAISGSRLQFENLRYSSPMLAALRNELKPDKGNQSVRVDVLYSWRDISVAYVYDPIRKSYFDVPCVTHGVTPGMTLDEYLLLRKAGKRQRRATDYDLAEDRVAMKNEIRDRQKRAARKLEQDKAAKRKAKSAGGQRPATTDRPGNAKSPLLSQLNKKEQQRLMALGDAPFETPPSERPSGNRFDYTIDDIDSVSKTTKE